MKIFLLAVSILFLSCEKESSSPLPQVPVNMLGEYMVDKTCGQSNYAQTLIVSNVSNNQVLFSFSNGEKYTVTINGRELTIVQNSSYSGTGNFNYPDIFMEIARFSGTGNIYCSFWAKHK